MREGRLEIWPEVYPTTPCNVVPMLYAERKQAEADPKRQNEHKMHTKNRNRGTKQ